jgi:hypothetical protein
MTEELCPMCEERIADREDGLCTDCVEIYPLEDVDYLSEDGWDEFDLDMVNKILG